MLAFVVSSSQCVINPVGLFGVGGRLGPRSYIKVWLFQLRRTRRGQQNYQVEWSTRLRNRRVGKEDDESDGEDRAKRHEQLRDDEFPPADMPITDLNIDVAKRDQFSWS
jgi:hypothetical protein